MNVCPDIQIRIASCTSIGHRKERLEHAVHQKWGGMLYIRNGEEVARGQVFEMLRVKWERITETLTQRSIQKITA